jgi:myo-inositol-1(or 4)-monophosphatase
VTATHAELLQIAVAVTRRAAQAAQELRGEGIHQVATKTSRTDVVTEADRAVERLVVTHLSEIRPADAVLGEEYGPAGPAGPARRGGVRWILDPIDGTVNYLYGLAPYAVSLAAEVDGQVVCGVVREATTGEEWTAVRAGGAYRGGRRLAGSPVAELGQALVATGFAYAARRRAHQARVLAELLPEVRDVRRLGSAAVDLCLAAEGRVDAYYERGLNPWDYAAGVLIASEAGLRVSGLGGAPPGPDFVLAAPPGIYQALHDRLVKLDAAAGP